jgi:hypothetical protein
VALLCIDELGYMELDRRGAEHLHHRPTNPRIRVMNTATRGTVAASGGVGVSFADPGNQFGVDL